MVSDSELLNRLRGILGSSDLDTATAGSVRRQLEEEFGINLHDRRAFIREQIDVFLQNQSQNDHVEQEENGNNEEMETQEEDDDEEKIEGSGKVASKSKRYLLFTSIFFL